MHVGAHQRAVRVIVLKERDQRGRDRHKLLWRHVHQRDLVTRSHQVVARLACRDQLFNEGSVFGQFRRSLRDGVLLLFHRGEIFHIAGDLVVHDLTVRRFDKAILVDAAERSQRVDQTDVRAFRRLNRADTAIVGGVNVAHFKASALTRQTARPQRRDTALVRDFRKRVRLVHELRQLRGTEELTHGCHSRLGVDQIVRHHGRDIDAAHALLDRALHAQQANAVLVFKQFADRTHTAVAEIVDVVDFTLAVLEADQFLDHGKDVFLAQRRHRVFGVQFQTHVELHTANGGKVIPLSIEEQAFEQRFSGFLGRRFARTHHLVDGFQTLIAVLGLVDFQRVADPRAGIDLINVEQLKLVKARLVEDFDMLQRHFVARFDIDAAGLLVDNVIGSIATNRFLGRQQQFG